MEEAHAPLGPTLHRLSNFVVDGDDSRATARTYVDALLMPASPDGTIHRGIGYYDDELIRSDDGRSEEHTSELQSLMRISYAVFCLKKKQNETNDAEPRIPKPPKQTETEL